MAKRIETSRLILEPLTKTQLLAFHSVFSDPQATLWSLRGRSTSLDESKELIEGAANDPAKPDHLCWMIYLGDQPDTCIGVVNLRVRQAWEPGQVEPPQHGPVWVVAYMFLPEYWGKGYATESVDALIKDVREAIQPCTLQAYINPANPPSAKVITKLGFELAEKVIPGPDEPKILIGGEWRDRDVWRYTRRIGLDESKSERS